MGAPLQRMTNGENKARWQGEREEGERSTAEGMRQAPPPLFFFSRLNERLDKQQVARGREEALAVSLLSPLPYLRN